MLTFEALITYALFLGTLVLDGLIFLDLYLKNEKLIKYIEMAMFTLTVLFVMLSLDSITYGWEPVDININFAIVVLCLICIIAIATLPLRTSKKDTLKIGLSILKIIGTSFYIALNLYKKSHGITHSVNLSIYFVLFANVISIVTGQNIIRDEINVLASRIKIN